MTSKIYPASRQEPRAAHPGLLDKGIKGSGSQVFAFAIRDTQSGGFWVRGVASRGLKGGKDFVLARKRDRSDIAKSGEFLACPYCQ